MKRRSARPFTVEVKHTRTSRASLTEAVALTRSGKDLWPELAATDLQQEAQEAQEVHPSLPIRHEEKKPEAPVRRILPSLVPMFAVPAETEAQPDPTLARTPRVRRPRMKSEVAPASLPADTATRAVEEGAKPRAIVEITDFVSVRTLTNECQPAMTQAQVRRWTSRRSGDLRLGERWKRRLPERLR